MQRKDLLLNNGKIFVGQGKAIAANAASDVRILVVGNPCNTNCLVAYENGKSVPADRWHAMTRLDHNRAVAALALKAGVPNETVTNMTIWGNHSNTQFADFNGQAVEMEGGAIAQVTERFGSSVLNVRSLSDLAGGHSHIDFAAFVHHASATAALVVSRLVPVL